MCQGNESHCFDIIVNLILFFLSFCILSKVALTDFIIIIYNSIRINPHEFLRLSKDILDTQYHNLKPKSPPASSLPYVSANSGSFLYVFATFSGALSIANAIKPGLCHQLYSFAPLWRASEPTYHCLIHNTGRVLCGAKQDA